MLPLTLEGVEVRWPGLDAPALTVPRLTVPAGTRLAIGGPSGSGKSTLVNVITGLMRPTGGNVTWGETRLSALGESRRDAWRGANLGLVMQDFHLFPGLSALENVLLPARLARLRADGLVGHGRALLTRVGLSRPDQAIETMSRGEMQRVAVARALLRRPAVIVADEPTASLDAASAAAIVRLLVELSAETGASLVMVSHDPGLIAAADRRLVLRDGRIESDSLAEVAA